MEAGTLYTCSAAAAIPRGMNATQEQWYEKQSFALTQISLPQSNEYKDGTEEDPGQHYSVNRRHELLKHVSYPLVLSQKLNPKIKMSCEFQIQLIVIKAF